MKTKEELNALKEEVETLNKKLAELTEEELNQVTGGDYSPDGLFIIDVEQAFLQMAREHTQTITTRQPGDP